jgi:hypothetical protein
MGLTSRLRMQSEVEAMYEKRQLRVTSRPEIVGPTIVAKPRDMYCEESNTA